MKIQKNVSLAQYTNYKIGGLAQYFCEVGNEEEVIEALDFAKDKNIPVFILGSGTNVLVSDKGFSGLVIKLQVTSFKFQDRKITVGAGTLLSDAVSFALRNNLSGLEWAAGIPGTIGGAIRGNAGAFGGEMKDIVESVKALSVEHGINYELKELDNKELEFGYRTSLIKERGGIILEAILKLRKTEDRCVRAKKKAQEHVNYRKKRHPLEYPNCGSVFKNVERKNMTDKDVLRKVKGEIIPAALLIAEAGLVGVKKGNAQISKKHSNFIINLGKAKAQDVKELIKLCQKEVYRKFKVKLETEVQFIGY